MPINKGDKYNEFVVKNIERNYEGKIIYVFLLCYEDSSELGLEIMYRDKNGDYDDGCTVTIDGCYYAQLAYIQNGEFCNPSMDEEIMLLSLSIIKQIKEENKQYD